MPITTFIEIFDIHCRWFQPTAFVFNPKPKARKWIMPIAILQWRLLIFMPLVSTNDIIYFLAKANVRIFLFRRLKPDGTEMNVLYRF